MTPRSLGLWVPAKAVGTAAAAILGTSGAPRSKGSLERIDGDAEGVSGGETSCHLLGGSKIARAIRPRMCPIKAGGAWDEGVEGNRGLEKVGGPRGCLWAC